MNVQFNGVRQTIAIAVRDERLCSQVIFVEVGQAIAVRVQARIVHRLVEAKDFFHHVGNRVAIDVRLMDLLIRRRCPKSEPVQGGETLSRHDAGCERLPKRGKCRA